MKPIRFRQSYAKTLLHDCPALLRLQMVNEGRKATKAMNAGSLLDYLVFGQSDRYELVDARYRSGPRDGQPCTDWTGKEAREARAEVEQRGLLPVLAQEVENLTPTADAIRARIVKLAREMAGSRGAAEILYQPAMEWTSALGVDCAGTPDVVVVVNLPDLRGGPDLLKVCTIDVKHTAALGKGKFERQIADMCWDVQAAAYREGSAKWVESERGKPAFHLDHVILATSSIAVGLPPVARLLAPAFLSGGHRRWEKAQREWRFCVETDEWAGYDEEPAEPSFYYVRQHVEAFDPTSETPEEEP
jgi:hypothetical protein